MAIQEVSDKKGIILEYIDILLGNRESFSSYYFKKTKYSNEQMALIVFKFAFENLINWTPYELRDCLNMKMLKALKLSGLMPYIQFPTELKKDPSKRILYVISKIYPDKVKMSFMDITIKVYDDFLNKITDKLPRDFFTGNSEGRNRACICLLYIISRYYSYMSVRELYEMFSHKDIASTLKSYKLLSACKEHYMAPLEFLHDALPLNLKNELYFHYYLFELRLNGKDDFCDEFNNEGKEG